MKTIKITISEFINLIQTIGKGQIATITQATSAKIRIRDGKAFGIVDPKSAIKVSKFQVKLGTDYDKRKADAVKSGKIEDFEKGQSWWQFTNDTLTTVINKNAEKVKNELGDYFTYMPHISNFKSQNRLLVDGKITQLSKVAHLITPTEKKDLPINVLTLANLLSVSFLGQKYKLIRE